MPVPVDGEEAGGPFDPERATPSITEPPSSTAPDPTDSPGSATDAAPAAEPQDEEVTQDPLPEFDERWKDDFEGMLYLGRLTRAFEYLGHRFVIRTLTVGEVMDVGLLHQPFVENAASVKAYQAAVVAACVVSVDGKPMPMPITIEAADTRLVNRFEYVRENWFPPVLDAVYEQYLLLEATVIDVLEAMGEA